MKKLNVFVLFQIIYTTLKNKIAMICQFAPPRLFVIFTSVESKWIYLVETFRELNNFHDINNTNIQHEDENILEPIKGDLVTFAPYYDHRMKCFHKLLQSTNTLFG
jgi:hypothetical protein